MTSNHTIFQTSAKSKKCIFLTRIKFSGTSNEVHRTPDEQFWEGRDSSSNFNQAQTNTPNNDSQVALTDDGKDFK